MARANNSLARPKAATIGRYWRDSAQYLPPDREGHVERQQLAPLSDIRLPVRSCQGDGERRRWHRSARVHLVIGFSLREMRSVS